MSTHLSAACYLVPSHSCPFPQWYITRASKWHLPHKTHERQNICPYVSLVMYGTTLHLSELHFKLMSLMSMIQMAVMPSVKALLPFSFCGTYMAKLYFLLFNSNILCSTLTPSTPCSLHRHMPDHPSCCSTLCIVS